MSYAVETRELTRIFAGKKKRRRRAAEEVDESVGPVTALDQVSLKIEEGELFGMLGPNGAGKTTLIKILATLLLPTSGQALVAGHERQDGAPHDALHGGSRPDVRPHRDH